MAKDDKRVAVYIPFTTLLTAIETLEQGLPARLHRSVWSSFSGGVQAQVLSAFKFLGLIDEQSKVQPALKRVVEERENRNAVLMEVIADAYPAVIELADQNASQKDFEDAMREYGVQGTTLDIAAAFTQLEPDDREFVLTLIDKMRGYKNA